MIDPNTSLVIDRRGVWTFQYEGEPLGMMVRIVETRDRRERYDYLVETNTGDRTWVPDHTVRLLEMAPDMSDFG